MFAQKLDHKAIEEPRLLDLASVARTRQGFQFTVRYAFLEREGALMAVILAAGQNDRRAGDALKKPFRVGLCQRFKLMDDGLYVGVPIAFREKVREKVRQWSRAKGCAQIFERVGPAVVNTVGSVVGNSSFGEFLIRIVAGPAQNQRCRLIRPEMIHVRSE